MTERNVTLGKSWQLHEHDNMLDVEIEGQHFHLRREKDGRISSHHLFFDVFDTVEEAAELLIRCHPDIRLPPNSADTNAH